MTDPDIAVGEIVEERHKHDWEPRQQGEVIAADAESITVRWHSWGEGQRIERDRIGNKMTDLVRRPIR